MTNIIIESVRAFLTGVMFVTFIRYGQRSPEIRDVKGWRCFLIGFALIFFGTLLDITDNFPGLNKFVIIGDTSVEAILEKIDCYLLGLILMSYGVSRWLPRVIEHQRRIAKELGKKIDQVKSLHGLLPICAVCKKIRDDKGYWKQIESYISAHSEAEFTHGYCPECGDKMLAEVDATSTG
jgi:hypothetical protein